MSDFWLYFKIGMEHVLSWTAYDHLLFLVVLAVSYRFASWKRLLVLVTLFTLGHTLSLLLANYDVVSVSSSYVEFLIPVTILVTALYNIAVARKSDKNEKYGLLYVTTIFFGLIHGFGFARDYKMLNDTGELLPLVEFALGIELAQVIVVVFVLIASFVFQGLFRRNRRDWILVVSSIVIGMILPILVESWPF